MNARVIYTIKALTDIWTGSVKDFEEKKGQLEEKTGCDRLITTGLLGAIRWWFEVVVRGLGGFACDPNDTECEERKHCVVCEFFGCTGWARKFRFKVTDENKQVRKTQIKKNDKFTFSFTPMRVINQNEWALLDLTLRLIAKYGAIGGKTVFKPSDEKGRQNLLYHRDFGLIEIVSTSSNINPDYSTMKEYVFLKRWRKVEHGDFAWASLKNFWCVNGKYLARQDQNKSTFNQVLGRKKQDKSGKDEKGKRVIRRIELLDSQNDTISKWLVGSQQESKKVFSFKNPPRAFGFIKPGLIEFREMKQRLEKAWGKGDWRFLTGEEIGQKLVGSEGVGE